MTNNNFPYYYRDGSEICLGDYIVLRGRNLRGYIARIWEPYSHASKLIGLPQGCFMIHCIGTGERLEYGFDAQDVLGPEHADTGLELIHRATLYFHIRYSWLWLRELTLTLSRLCIKPWRLLSPSWWEYVYYRFTEYTLSLLELLQAVAFGPGKNVRQLCEQYKNIHCEIKST